MKMSSKANRGEAEELNKVDARPNRDPKPGHVPGHEHRTSIVVNETDVETLPAPRRGKILCKNLVEKTNHLTPLFSGQIFLYMPNIVQRK